MDWMDKAMVTSEIAQLVQRMDQARGRIYWRSFSEKVHIPPLTFLNATKVRKEGRRQQGAWVSAGVEWSMDASLIQ